jgi:hypothetical protein
MVCILMYTPTYTCTSAGHIANTRPRPPMTPYYTLISWRISPISRSANISIFVIFGTSIYVCNLLVWNSSFTWDINGNNNCYYMLRHNVHVWITNSIIVFATWYVFICDELTNRKIYLHVYSWWKLNSCSLTVNYNNTSNLYVNI